MKGSPLRFRPSRRGRAAALALALTATSALTAPVAAAHAAAPPPAVAVVAPDDALGTAQHADHAERKAERAGAWRVIAGAASAVGSAAGAALMLLRRAAGSKVVQPVVKAAAATARLALGGASVLGRVGLWAGRTVVAVVIGALALLAGLLGLVNAGPGATLALGVALGAATTAAVVWAARRRLWRAPRAA